MTKQQIFDKVCRHLRKQGVACTLGLLGEHPSGTCIYRAVVKGVEYRCAVGALLDMRTWVSSDICKHRNSQAIPQLRAYYGDAALKYALGGFDDFGFLSSLQTVHDQLMPSQWAKYLEELADAEGLEMNVKFPKGLGEAA